MEFTNQFREWIPRDWKCIIFYLMSNSRLVADLGHESPLYYSHYFYYGSLIILYFFVVVVVKNHINKK